MKAVTQKLLEHAIQGVLARPFIDRSASRDNAVIEEQRSITKQFNGNTTPAYLYNYYVTICYKPTYDLTDDAKVGKQLGLTARKVADTRRALTKAGWINFMVTKTPKFRQAYWFIGKDVVQLSTRLLKAETISDAELLSVGLITEAELVNYKGAADEE